MRHGEDRTAADRSSAARRSWPVAVLVASVALAGCGDAVQPGFVHRGEVGAVQLGRWTAQDVAQAQTDLGLDLLRTMCAEQPRENLLISPTSVAEALTLLYPAAGGSTAEDLQALMHLPQWSPDLVAALHEHTRALGDLRYDGDLDDDAPDSLRMSNRIWTASGLEPERTYLDDVATASAAEVENLDFAGDASGATDRINNAVRLDTGGLIERLFDSTLDPGTRVVLTNALHLDATWRVPFTAVEPEPFTTAAGESVTVPMMSGSTGQARQDEGWTSVDLPYRDGTLMAVAVLPPVGEDPCTVDGDTLRALSQAPPTEVDVEVPRLSIEQTHELLGHLAGLGLPVEGDYSGLGEDGLRVDRVVQKTVLEVDEVGTVAAAATGISMETSSRLPLEVVTLDRPFLLLLTDTATTSPLFVAVVHDPSA
ncbi:serpin family protein [Actinotalea sp. K2]|uniref:serpin family protein n=1 Tax=Actinotalea sp. K2 TaxID=2939438 RepID=UPI002017E0FD|nr:serpin family protein [Actinotalea sp. K2]MCL3862979.1 hypothetical protein [Actinotalea sp. K2]